IGTRYLVDALTASSLAEPFLQALRKVQIVSRGPKPVAVLNELRIPVTVTVPEPNTWRQVLEAMANLNARSVAVQEYGVPNVELVNSLRQRGLSVTPVPIYRWDLPEDLAPLERAVRHICDRWCDAVIFLSSVQFTNLMRIAERAAMRDSVVLALLNDIVLLSIGPIMSDTLIREGLRVDFEPRQPKLGPCIRQFSEQAGELIAAKRGDRR